MNDASIMDPISNCLDKEVIFEILTPNGTVIDTHLGQTSVEVEHTNQTWPLPAPVCNGQNGTAVIAQTGQHMIAVYGCARLTISPSAANASQIFCSISAWAGQQTWLAESRKSPLATR
jgi:hypothetical protein